MGQRVSTPESSPVAVQQGVCDAGAVAAGVSLPEGEGSRHPLPGSETQVDPATWRSYSVRLLDARTGWDIFDITLLRPTGWMAQHSRQIAGRSEVWVDFEELNAHGWAQVIEERACPPIAEGSGRVITATITHSNDDVRTLTLDGGETLFVTGNHRMFSATANDWVPVQDLEIGEELQTSTGRKSVASLGFQKGRHQVYNMEVEAEHCYFVGDGEVLTHNGCETGPTASQKPAQGEGGKEGVIYLRSDKDGNEYVGQAESVDRFKQRKKEHLNDSPEKGFTFQELERVPQGGARTLDAAEEDWIRAGGGPKKQGGRLDNGRYQMNDKRYKGTGGNIGKPTSKSKRRR